jgi:hypothetical protein
MTQPEGRLLQFPEDRLRVVRWSDPVLDKLGHDIQSIYVERFWLPVVGPSALLLLRRLDADLKDRPADHSDDLEIRTAEVALELGLGMKGGRHGPFWRALERACRFGAGTRNGRTLALRPKLPPLTARQVERLPPTLQLAHPALADSPGPEDAA